MSAAVSVLQPSLQELISLVSVAGLQAPVLLASATALHWKSKQLKRCIIDCSVTMIHVENLLTLLPCRLQ
jgi:hypothetical protein